MVGLDIEPVSSEADEEKHYDYWHGDGAWELANAEPPVFTEFPQWRVAGASGGVGHTWGTVNAEIESADGFSRARMVITADLDCGEIRRVTIAAVPALGATGDFASITFDLECGSCP